MDDLLMKLTAQARKLWEKIPADIRVKLLNNVWCSTCASGSGIGNAEGKVEGGDLILRGACTRCGGEVARVIEGG
jgi:hypothetical protein